MGLTAAAKMTRLGVILTVFFVFILLNLVRMQLFRYEFYQGLSEKNRIRIVYLEAPRGRILDRNGLELAASRLSFNCAIIPSESKKTRESSFRILGALLEEDVEVLKKRYSKKKASAFNTVLLAEDIPPAQAMAIEERLEAMPGVLIETRPQRAYPYGESAGHLVGFTGPVTEDEKDELELGGYRASDWIGRDGIEKTYESYLRGFSGGLQLEVNSRGRTVKTLGVQEPREGKDIQLTVDGKLQAFVQDLLKGQKGAVIVMELKEGGLLSLNSSPSFDPNLFSSVRGRKDVGKYFRDSQAPLINRGIRGEYPPGSIFKIVTTWAALAANKINEKTTFDCPGYLMVGNKRFGCWSQAGHGPQALFEAMAHSCDVYFYSIGLSAGVDAIHEKALLLGFSQMTGIDLPGEKQGFVPSRAWKKRHLRLSWFEGDTANISIGQGFLQVTPIQALGMIAAVALEGRLPKPHLIEKINQTKVSNLHTKFINFSRRHLVLIDQALNQVVQSDSGTGRLARAVGFKVAGKTGTAESGQEETHAWFVGFAPAENPKIALVVFLENGGHGGVEAATIAAKIWPWLTKSFYL